MKSREELLDNLQIIINNNDYNKQLINKLSIKFDEKGFSMQRPNQIFSGSAQLESLGNTELLTLTDGLYNLTQNNKNLINPKDYFSDSEIVRFESYQRPIEEQKDSLILKNVVQIDDLQWICPFWTLEEIYNAQNNAQLSYNFNTQREATYKKTATGDILIAATLNKESVRDISEEMFENKFTPNLITLNVRLIDGKKPRLKYNENTKELIIKPQYKFVEEDGESEIILDDTTFIDILDGFHRINGALWAIEKAKQENKQLKGGLIVSIICMTEAEARNYIAREAKRNDMSEEFTKALTNDDYNKIVAQINDYGDKNTNILKNKIADTREELNYTDKLTTSAVIREGIKQTDIDIKDAIEIKMMIPRMIEIINMLISYILRYKFNSDMSKMSESAFLQPNIFVGYIAIANKLKNDKDYMDKIFKIAELLDNKDRKDFVNLGIYSKNLQQKKVYEYFENIVKEVI